MRFTLLRSLTVMIPVMIAIVALAITSSSCQLLLGVEDRQEAPLDADSPKDNNVEQDSATPNDDPCTTIGTPARPTTPDDGRDGDFVFALSHIALGLDSDDAGGSGRGRGRGGAGPVPSGLNLDRTCTCPGPDSCSRPSGAERACDDDGGLGHDNETRAAMAILLSQSDVFSEAALNQNLRDGVSGALLRLQRYNGSLDDSRVTVSFYGAIALEGAGPAGHPTDRWIVDEASLADPSTRATAQDPYAPRYSDSNAFVTNGTLVASFDFPLDVGGNSEQVPLRLDLRAGAIVATIDATTGTVRGVLAGRWQTSSILSTVETLPDPFNAGKKLCRGSEAYRLVRNLICSSSDVTTDPTLDNTSSPCNALSTVVGFEATLARFGATRARRLPPFSCDDAGAPAPSCADPP